MAGDWIKMRADLQTHPKVVRIASALKADKLRVIGGLHAVWCLFDAHSEDGVLDGYTTETLDDLVAFPGFSDVLVSVGWLESTDDHLVIPRFGEHNGQSAKRRAQETQRKRDARNLSAPDADKKRSREERRKEEVKEHMSDEPDDAATEVIEYLNVKCGSKFRPVKANIKLVVARMAEGATAEDCRAVIDAKVAEWKDDKKMAYYLRPDTLFNATKFAQYAGQIGVGKAGDEWWKSAGFDKEWEATNAGCTAVNAYLWRDGKRVKEPA